MSTLKKTYLFIIAFTILNILLLAFIVFPLLKGIKKSSEAFLSEKNKIVSLSKEKESRETLEDLYKNYQSDLDKIEKVFVDSEVPIEFINFLERTASTSNARLKILSMAIEKEGEGLWPSLSFQLSVIGSFPDFSGFLEKLESSSYLIETIKLSTRALSEKETKSKEFEGFVSTDTNTLLSIKVFAR